MKAHGAKALAMDGLYEGGRMFVGSVSVAYLLSLGYSPSVVALLKSVQAVVVLVGEFPTGVIGDYFGRKLSLLASLIVAIFGFLCFLDASQLLILVLGEALLALSLCLWSGSYEAWALDVGKIEESKIQEFFHINGSVNQVTVLVTGLLGGILAGQAGLYWYAFVAAILTLSCLFIFLLCAPSGNQGRDVDPSRDTDGVWRGLLGDAKSSIQMVLSSGSLTASLALMIALQFSVQPMLHYWQPLVASYYGDNGTVLGVFFAVFCGGSALISWVCRKSRFENVVGLTLVWLGLLALIGLTGNKATVSIALVVAQITYFYLRSLVNSRVASAANPFNRASVLSLTSLISRVGMFTSLFVVSLTLGLFDTNEQGIEALYIVIPGFGALGIVAARLIYKMAGTGQETSV